MKHKGMWVATVLLASGSFLSAAQQDGKKTTKGTVVETARNGIPSGAAGMVAAYAATNDPAYVIGAEDVLDIAVWKEPDESRVVPVRPDGRISLPLIHDVQAAGLSPQQLTDILTEKLKSYLNDPQVTVIVTAINSQRVFVVGEVLRAGAFPLLPGMNVLQALSSSGGFTPYANVKKIHILRQQGGKQIVLPFNYRDVLNAQKPEQNIKLEAGDTIVVP
jgi:polysaccharide export outer membrane protein